MNLLDTIKLANEVADKFKYTEVKQALVVVRMEAVELADEVVRLREENRTLRETARLRAEMVFRDNVYWQRSGETETGPFCPKCFGGNERAVQMLDIEEQWKCPVCGTQVWKPGGRARWNASVNPPLPRDNDQPW